MRCRGSSHEKQNFTVMDKNYAPATALKAQTFSPCNQDYVA